MSANISIETDMSMCERDDNEGLCIECGTEHFGIEPDARKYTCDNCGMKTVYGAEELLFMIVP